MADNTDGVLTYQWVMDSNHALNFGEVEPQFTAIEGATEATYTATEPGHYRAIITNTRNLATKTAESEISRITYAAKTPVLEEGDVNTKVFQVDSLTEDNCPTVYMDADVESDGYTVSWYLSESNVNTPVVEGIVLAPGVLKASFNPKDYQAVIETIAKDQDIDGAYFAIVTNHVNGSEASTEVPEYDDMFKITY